MTQATWTTVDDYFAALLLPPDPILDETLQATRTAGLPPINVSPLQGKLLQLLALSIGAQCILEIGTLAGYSTIWLARALPDNGLLTTLEAVPLHAQVARANFERAGLSDKIDLRLGSAHETLPQLAAENPAPYDLIFIDADKPSTADYFTWALKLARPGSLIIVDNVVRNGAVTDAESVDSNVQGIRRFNERLAAEPRVSATAVQTVGSKGYDGLVIARVNV